MFLIIPYHVDVPMHTRPWMNWVIIGVTILFYPLCGMGGDLTSLGESLVLGKGPLGWVGPARAAHAAIDDKMRDMNAFGL